MCCKVQGGCQRPDRLKARPVDCTPEQIKECHGDVQGHPCVESAGCEHPEKLRSRPADCSPEQIRECHGDVAVHPCK